MASVTADIPQTSPPGEAQRPAPAPARLTFEELVRRHQPRVARLAQRLLGWPADVEDVVQEVFIAAWRGYSKFRGESSPETWLTRITINECRRHRRRRLLKLSFLRRFARHRNSNEPQASGLDHDERMAHVREKVRLLPARYREVIVLRYLEELDVQEIMKVLKLNRAAVDVRLHRGRVLLKEDLVDMVRS
jgi:RNA polymerase sigma-70 factor (ECF subfamily)